MPPKGKYTHPKLRDEVKEEVHQPKDCTQHWEDATRLKNGEEEYKKFKQPDEKSEPEGDEEAGSAQREDQGHEKQSSTKKRGGGANQKGPNKKQKSNSKPKGSAGDKTRLPKKGQKVQWHSLPGYVDGEVVEVVYDEKTVEGKSVKAGKEDPRIVLKSSTSGKIAVHKPEAVYFD